MSNLSEINKSLTLDSREVGKMIGKEHHKLLRDIREYISQMKEANEDNPKMDTPINPIEYFVESTYVNSQNKTQPCYLLTKLGCEFVSNKLTGVKGTAFTAIYTKRFNLMENQLQHPKDSYMIEDPIERAKVWIKEQEEKKQLELANRQKDQLIGELKPKADYTDSILKNPGLVTITQIAADYGLSGVAMNKLLHDLKVQYKQSGQWLLYSQHKGKGYTHSQTTDIVHKDGRPDVKMNTKWTQKGRLFLYDLLKENGILPVIEQDVKEKAV